MAPSTQKALETMITKIYEEITRSLPMNLLSLYEILNKKRQVYFVLNEEQIKYAQVYDCPFHL